MFEVPFERELVPSDVSDTRTHLEEFEGKPETIVREMPLDRLEKRYERYHLQALDIVSLGKRLFKELEDRFDIDVPVKFVVGKDVVDKPVLYSLTDRVYGPDLSAMPTKEFADMRDEIDQFFSTVVRYYETKLLSDEWYLQDLYKPNNFAYGPTANDSRDRFRFIDPDLYMFKAKVPLYKIMKDMSDLVRPLENKAGMQFAQFRQAAEDFLGPELDFDPRDKAAKLHVASCRADIEKFLAE